jgi:hypothetical protein
MRGMHLDPMRVKLPNAEPLPTDLLADFLVRTAPLLTGLQTGGSDTVLAR